MSVTTNQPRGMNLPGTKPPIVPVTHDNVRDWWALLVNRKAYTRQSANPHPETSRHYHYQPKNKDSGQPLELHPPTVRKHLAGWITVGLYASGEGRWPRNAISTAKVMARQSTIIGQSRPTHDGSCSACVNALDRRAVYARTFPE